MPITWKNVSAPDFGAVSDMTARAGNAFQGALNSLGSMVDQQEAQLDEQKAANTQQALEAIQGIKNMEEYRNTSFENIIGQFGSEINRKEVFNAFTGRDEQIYSEQDALEMREDKSMLKEYSGIIDNYVSSSSLKGMDDRSIIDGFEVQIADLPAHIKAQLRTKLSEQLEWENQLTPEEQRMYDVNAKRLQREYDLVDKNVTEMIQEQQAIVGDNPANRINSIDAQLTTAEYISKYAPDSFELSYGKWEGDDFADIDEGFKADAAKIANRMVDPTGKTRPFKTVPPEIIDFVIKTSIRTSGDVPEIRMGTDDEVKRKMANALIEFDAYNKRAAQAKQNIRNLERKRTTAANTLDKGLVDVRNSFKSRKTLEGNK